MNTKPKEKNDRSRSARQCTLGVGHRDRFSVFFYLVFVPESRPFLKRIFGELKVTDRTKPVRLFPVGYGVPYRITPLPVVVLLTAAVLDDTDDTLQIPGIHYCRVYTSSSQSIFEVPCRRRVNSRALKDGRQPVTAAVVSYVLPSSATHKAAILLLIFYNESPALPSRVLVLCTGINH